MGHSDESARKICGSIEAKQGSSSMERYGAADMSQEMEKKPEDGGPKIIFSQPGMTRLVKTAMDEGATKTVALLKEKVNIEEEEAPAQSTT